jgi:hypothetical protein
MNAVNKSMDLQQGGWYFVSQTFKIGGLQAHNPLGGGEG